MLIVITLLLCAGLNSVQSLDILGVFPAQVRSHFFAFQPFMQELAKRGHNVTVISYYADKKPRDNYHVIDLSENAPVSEVNLPITRSAIKTFFIMSIFHVMGGPYGCRILLTDENVQNLWITQRKFDVIIVEQFDSDCALGLAYKLGAPVVGVTSHMLLPWHYNRLGVPYNPSYVLFDFLEGGTKPTFFQRLQRAYWYSHFYFVNKYITQRLEQSIVAEFFDDVPSLEELGANIKFLLLYQNFILSGSSLLPSNIKEVGGYHIKEPKPLPDDFQKYIDESEHGVIYISFGSNMRTSTLPQTKLESIIAAVQELPQRVIFKWERKTLPGNPKNIYVSKWLPQNDILAHPKILAFFSHCGLLGATEAIHYGVPLLCMPIFGDQPSNAAAAEEAGLGVQIDFNDLTKDNILKKLKTILDPQFRARVKLLSKAWRDRPVSPMDSAIFWTEFAARHNFTYKSRSAEVPLYQYLCLDAYAVLLLILMISVFSIKCLVSLVLNRLKVGNMKSKRE
ncbi:UDP-glucosyltransferase 2-like [Epargyreus clarus]|uniref:UDP-glucosyltransferase 2-like n=1 Tax=Epargyreus clarus TaxID=520877 RepID=UPI003C2B57F2